MFCPDNPIISIIVPVYNTEKYIAECIHSILQQSVAAIELILIDDGSTDKCPAIIEEEAKKDNRIIVRHKPNAGQQAAIADGIKLARGEWVAFVDSDDTLPIESLKTLLDHTSDETDIVVGFSYPGDGSVTSVPIEEWRRRMLKSDIILCTRWGKLYRRTLFNEDNCYVPAKIRVGEDMVMNIKLAFISELPVTIVNEKIYNYNRHEGSISSSWQWDAVRLHELYQAVVQAIPDKYLSQKYLFSAIQNGLQSIQRVVWKGSRKERKELPTSDLFRQVKNDAKDWNYQSENLEERLLLRQPSSALTLLTVYFNKTIHLGGLYIERHFLKK